MSAASVDSQFLVDPRYAGPLVGRLARANSATPTSRSGICTITRARASRPEVIGLAHVDRAVGHFQSLGLLQRFA